MRELRQNASKWLARVAAGESFEVTDRGRPVALLVPAPGATGVEALVATGRMTLPSGPLDLGPPLAPAPGVPLPSEILAELRADER